VNRMALICLAAILWTSMQSSISACCLVASYEDTASITPGMYWTLSSRWRWNASGVGDYAGWRVEAEDWNDTLTIQEASRGELTLQLKRAGEGSSEAEGSFIIDGRVRDSWAINREYSIRVNSTTFRDVDRRPVRWVSSVKQLEATGSVPQMWIDESYRYVEVQFQVSGTDRLNLGGVVFDTWVVSYRNLTTGYWSAEGNHSTGFKEENLEYDQTRGLLLGDTYRGIYEVETREGGWNETETFTATTIDSNFRLFSKIQNSSLIIEVSLGAASVAAMVATLFVLHRRRAQGCPRSISLTCNTRFKAA
jgi:hypothetical protein